MYAKLSYMQKTFVKDKHRYEWVQILHAEERLYCGHKYNMPKCSYYCGSLCDKYTCSDVENVFTSDVTVLFFGHSKFLEFIEFMQKYPQWHGINLYNNAIQLIP